ncbi:hypothetical protein B0H11DRAFT_1304274 [Mycena galericulata]|nr:hypothetical protein B0H11DRAFT_1304274 [Mycena galericulata]
MQPLRRRSTPQSVHSWWSDSNPPGATISLHALAKPLSKFLYHRQASGIIAKGADSPLSRETVEILTTYLTFKDIFPSTRALVLTYLGARAGRTEDDARAIVDGNGIACAMACAAELLQSSNPDVFNLTCHMLQNIAQHQSLRNAVDEIDPLRILLNYLSPIIGRRVLRQAIGPLTSALPKSSIEAFAAYLGSKDSLTPVEALILEDLCRHAAINATAIAHSLALLKSPSSDVVRLTCMMFGEMASYYPTPDLWRRHWMRGFDPCMHLVWLLDHESLAVRREAAHVLECIKASEEGAQSVTAALDWATQLANLDFHHTFLSLASEPRSD